MYDGNRFRKDIHRAGKKTAKSVKSFFRAEWKNSFDPFKCFWPCVAMVASCFFFLCLKLPFFSLRLLLKH